MAKSSANRLEGVHAILINPRQGIGSIQMLAAEHGFTDLTDFNQLFRERYGTGPAELPTGSSGTLNPSATVNVSLHGARWRSSGAPSRQSLR
jgi:AraC-like DNA-binding protein